MPTGKVAVFTASGVPFEIEELPTPEVEPGGMLIKNTHAVICGSDSSRLARRWGCQTAAKETCDGARVHRGSPHIE